MPSEAETKAASAAIRKTLGYTHGSSVNIGGIIIDFGDLARAALSAASAVRSETYGDAHETHGGGGSPVQTREDGIREAADCVARLMNTWEAQEHVCAGDASDTITSAILALLSQPEPSLDLPTRAFTDEEIAAARGATEGAEPEPRGE